MSKHYNIVMPIETTARELNAKLYMAIYFASNGFDCYIGNKSLSLEVAKRLDNVIYIDKGYHSGTSEKLYTELKENQCRIISLDEENGVDFKDFHMLNMRMPDHFFPYMDAVCLWGDAQYEHLKKYRENLDKTRIHITGHPRFDLLKTEFQELYASKVDGIKKEYGPFILFNTNSKYSNNINSREKVIANYSSRVKSLQDRLDYDDLRLDLNTKLIKRIAKDHHISVVIRPHPEEDITFYQQTFKDWDNVHAIYEDSAIYWILASMGMIHNHSTTGLEATMLGKVAMSYTPIQQEENFYPWIPIAASHQFHDEDSLIKFIINDQWDNKPKQINKILQDFFSFQETSMPKVLEVINKMLENSEPDKQSPPLLFNIFLYKEKMKLFKYWLLQQETGSVLSLNKLQGLDNKNVKKKFEHIKNYTAFNDHPIEINSLHTQLYKIFKK